MARLESSDPKLVETLAGAGNTAALALALDIGLPLPDDALPVAVSLGRTDAVRLLLARGATVSDSVIALAERALTEMSEWVPHKSREIVDMVRAGTGRV